MKNYLNQLFFEISEKLDLTDSQANSIEKSYNAVADWFNRNDSKLKIYDILIYPQGSMKLGTVVKPLVDDDYDIDMVCLLRNNANSLDAKTVKRIVGERLRENHTYKNMLQPEGKRCWTLKYSDNLNFHMDILPAIPKGKEAIKATHKQENTYEFIDTNPHGYAEWFKNKMKPQGNFSIRGSVENIPEFPKKTTLQKVIQLLKRHRDVMFQKNQENSPISIIITTLAARVFESTDNLVEAFEKIIKNLTTKIENRGGVYWIPNPVNTLENFADKWQEYPQKANAFFSWVKRVNDDYADLLSSKSREELLNVLYRMFGQKVVDLSHDDLGGFNSIVPIQLAEEKDIIPYNVRKALEASHRQKTPWVVPSWSIVKLEVRMDGNGYCRQIQSGEKIGKGIDLKFQAKHAIKSPYKVKWQVTNTGLEAAHNNCLRGDFYNSENPDINTRIESTRYSGIHYVQCFILKNGKCVAKSKEFIVNIV